MSNRNQIPNGVEYTCVTCKETKGTDGYVVDRFTSEEKTYCVDHLPKLPDVQEETPPTEETPTEETPTEEAPAETETAEAGN